MSTRRGAGALRPIAARGAGVLLTALGGAAVVVLVLGRLPDRREGALVQPLLAGLVVAALLGPVLQRAVVERLQARRGSARPPLAVVDAFSARDSRDTPTEELLMQLAEALRRDLRLSTVEVWSRSGTGLARLLAVPRSAAAATPLDAAQVTVLSRASVAGEGWLRTWLPELLRDRERAVVRVAVARYGGDVLAALVLDRPGDRFSPADDQLLADLAGRLGAALHSRRLDAALQDTLDDLRRANEDLRASRARLVAAADAERRRIERDIHDGAQQHLVALAVNLGLSRELLRDDPVAAAELLDELSSDLRETITQVRSLAHGIYPPLLREAGLAEAVRAAALRSPQPVVVEADDVPRCGPDVEAAVYFCCLEALANSAKHAQGAEVRLTLSCDDGGLRFVAVDDGPGADATAAHRGQGLQNMTDRLGAVGGTLRWSTSPGQGMRVEGSVPLRLREPAAAGA